jgi:hypothetical protein
VSTAAPNVDEGAVSTETVTRPNPEAGLPSIVVRAYSALARIADDSAPRTSPPGDAGINVLLGAYEQPRSRDIGGLLVMGALGSVRESGASLDAGRDSVRPGGARHTRSPTYIWLAHALSRTPTLTEPPNASSHAARWEQIVASSPALPPLVLDRTARC